MKSIYGKLIIGFLVSILFSFSIAGYFSLRKNANELGLLAVEELQNSTELIEDFMNLIDSDDLDKILQGYAATSEVSFYIESNQQKYIYGNMKEQHLSLKDVEFLKENIGQSIVLKDSSIRIFAKSIRVKNQDYIVYVQKDMSKREMIFLDSALIAVFCMLIAGSITFLVIADIIVKPISRLTKATNELSKGNYRVRVNYTGKDEIARLNRSFNQMAQQLAKQDETRQQFISDVSHEFQTPLTAIQGFATILKNEQLSDEQERSKTESDTKHDDWLHLQSQIRLLTSEKEVLTAKIAQLNEKCSKITSTRDHYWETQFAAREDELRKEWKLDITELEARHRNFVHDIAQFLTDTLHKEISADELLIKTGLNQLRAQADALGNHVKLLQKRIADNQSDVWEQWARGLFSSVSDGAIFTESAGELRYLLNELVSASSANRAIIRKLESLRKQKKILQSGSIYTTPKAPRTSIQSLICFAMSMSRLRRKPTHKPTFTL